MNISRRERQWYLQIVLAFLGIAVFAWALERVADAVEDAMAGAFAASDMGARVYRAPVASEGVCVVEAASLPPPPPLHAANATAHDATSAVRTALN